MSAAPLIALALLLGFQALGEIVAALTGVPIPGPVIGMALLTVSLTRGWISPDRVRPATDPLLRHMTFLFVPPGVGISLYLAEIQAHPLAITASVCVSAALVMAVTGITYQALRRSRSHG